MSAITLQNCLDASSYYLGESGTPTSEVTKRTLFANDVKKELRDLRNWSWELKTGAAINVVSGTTAYSLPSDFKNLTAMYSVQVTDQYGNKAFYQPVNEQSWDNITVNNLSDQVYWISGDPVSGYTLNINPSPTANVTNGINFRYFCYEGDFVSTTDTSRIPKYEVIAWGIAAKVLYGYREQAQYQLAQQEFQDAVNDLAMQDMKAEPFSNNAMKSWREAAGASFDFRTYY